MWQSYGKLKVMGDKYKSEISKPVNNPLLTGAGHGFPFDTFQGSSFLVPVSQDNPAILSDQIGEPDKFVGQDTPIGNGADVLTDPLNITVEAKISQAPPVQQTSSNSGYARLFNKFFGSGKSEQEKEKENEQSFTGSMSSTPRSFSPYVHVPNFQTVTPALQVPSVTQSAPPGSIPLDSNPGNPNPCPEVDKNPEIPSIDSKSSSQPNFNSPDYPFPTSKGNFITSSMFAPNQQPNSDQYPPPMSKSYPPPIQQNDPYHAPAGPDMSKPPLYNPNAPPLFKGDSSKTYRLCHNKRPVYAPIPGLTLSTSVSAPLMQSADLPATSTPPQIYTAPDISQPIYPPHSGTTAPPPVFPTTPVSQVVYPRATTPSHPVTYPQAPPLTANSNHVNSTVSSQSDVSSASSYFKNPGNSFPQPTIDLRTSGVRSTSSPSQLFQQVTPPVQSTPSTQPTPPPAQYFQQIPLPMQPSPPVKTTSPQSFQQSPIPVQSTPPVQAIPSQPFQQSPTPVQSTPPVQSIPSQSFQQAPPSVQSTPPVQPIPSQSFQQAPPSVQSTPSVQPIPSQSFQQAPTPVQTTPSVQPIPSQSFQQAPPSVQSTPPVQPIPSQSFQQAPTPVQTTPSVQSTPPLPYPTKTEEQNLFASISKENSKPAENNPPLLNPIAIHPKDNLPSNDQPQNEKPPSPKIIPPSFNHLAHVGRTGIGYRPPYHHWFFKKERDAKEYWYPFSLTDSVLLEQTYQSGKLDENTVIATDGGRYDVSIIKRTRTAVYWDETPKEVRRCSWFYKNQTESKYRPYDESTAYHLEEEYKKCVTTDSWRKRVDLNNEEYIIMYSTTNMAHFEGHFSLPDGWEADFNDSTQQLPTPVKMVKRGISDDFDIDDGESPRVDHLVFVVHGIGSACDFKFRTIEEAVDIFRSLSLKLIKDHFNSSVKQGLVNRIEILPISWHSHLHGEATGLDKKLESITLKSIPRLRNFTNDTLLDILFYTSPMYCEKIVQQVGAEITSLFKKFNSRNPSFNGSVSLVGHSLGSLILFDMLCHQKPLTPLKQTKLEPESPEQKLTRRMSGYIVGNAETRQPFVEYPQLPFEPVALFALGSPIGMFITVRGIDSLGAEFKLPTCKRFYNIFHPFDPVAYRIEALINPEMAKTRPVLIPHHKGRKRMHLELMETISRVRTDLKQRLVDSIRSTWNTVFQLTALGRADDGLEQEVDRVIERQIAGSESSVSLQDQEILNCEIGLLNDGRRIDYVLQEAPLESFNEYISAIRSHLIYWDSEDTILMILREIYRAEGIALDGESLSTQESFSTSSPSPSTPGIGWNVTDEPIKQHQGPGGQPPSYGFKNG